MVMLLTLTNPKIKKKVCSTLLRGLIMSVCINDLSYLCNFYDSNYLNGVTFFFVVRVEDGDGGRYLAVLKKDSGQTSHSGVLKNGIDQPPINKNVLQSVERSWL